MEDRLLLNDSRIPVARAQERTLRRSASVRLRGERRTQHFPAIAESTDSWTQPATHGSLRSLAPMPPGRDNGSLDDDLDSLASYGSVASCDHAYFARNGTTFSGRQMKYVVHCSSHGGATEEYLTPTQRANRKIRRLSALLQQTERDLEKKNLEIGRLTQEVVELRLSQGFKKDVTIPEDSTQDLNTSKDIITYQYNEVTTKNQELSVESPDSGRHECSHASSSLGDSGLFEDLGGPHVSAVEEREGEYELRLEKLLRNHSDQTRELKERHNDKVEKLLMRLTDVNNRYCELRTEHDQALDRLHQSSKERDVLRRTLEEQEERHKSMYLKMYLKGQEAARFEHADQYAGNQRWNDMGYTKHAGKAQQTRQHNAQNRSGNANPASPGPSTSRAGYSTQRPTNYQDGTPATRFPGLPHNTPSSSPTHPPAYLSPYSRESPTVRAPPTPNSPLSPTGYHLRPLATPPRPYSSTPFASHRDP